MVLGIEVFGRPAGWDPKTDSTVRMYVARLREKLREYYGGDGRHDPLIIEIPKGRYVPQWRRNRKWQRVGLTVAACLLLAVGGALLWKWATTRTIRSVAVLPLRNLDGNVTNEALADGLTDDLIHYLAGLPGLRVISQTSSFALKRADRPLREVGSLLDVEAVVEGTLQRDGQRVKLSARLIGVKDDRVLWTGAFERDLRDLFRLQQELASEVAQTLRPTLERRVSAAAVPDPNAYQDYLQGLSAWRRWTKDGLTESIAFFERAAEKEPRWARPWSALARAYHRQVFLGELTAAEAHEKARRAALRALEIDARSPESHAELAMVKWFRDRDPRAAEKELAQALELNPNSTVAWDEYGLYLGSRGRLQEAREAYLQAERLDPLSPEAASHVAGNLVASRRYDDAIARCRRLLDQYPKYHQGYEILIRAYVAKGACSEAVEVVRRLEPGAPQYRGAYALAVCGSREEARAILGHLGRLAEAGKQPKGVLASINAALGEKQRALDWLERAYHDGTLVAPLSHPEFDPLRGEPRFERLRRLIE